MALSRPIVREPNMRIAFAAVLVLVASAGCASAAKLEFTAEQDRFMEISRVVMEAGTKFGQGKLVDRVELVEKDVYRVGAGGCTITATLEDLKTPPNGMLHAFIRKVVAPREYTVRLGPITCSKPA